MKINYIIGIITAALFLTLCGCTNELSTEPPNGAEPVPPVETVGSNDIGEQGEVTVEPMEPAESIIPIEPIEDFQLPQCIEDQLYFYSTEELSNYIDSANHISQDSEAYALLAAMGLNNVATYYVIDSTKVPDGYEFIYAKLDSNFIEYWYSSTPEAYEEYPWLWPEETTLHYYIYPELYELNGRIRINGEIADGSDIVIKHTVGTNDHVTE